MFGKPIRVWEDLNQNPKQKPFVFMNRSVFFWNALCWFFGEGEKKLRIHVETSVFVVAVVARDKKCMQITSTTAI